ncbi:hypothetical protein EIP86_001711 [Pleurotus ostreatoroseus]|nr:hypothetical protein EIP86_001711 [Pleurotus ostreatoroseus]
MSDVPAPEELDPALWPPGPPFNTLDPAQAQFAPLLQDTYGPIPFDQAGFAYPDAITFPGDMLNASNGTLWPYMGTFDASPPAQTVPDVVPPSSGAQITSPPSMPTPAIFGPTLPSQTPPPTSANGLGVLPGLQPLPQPENTASQAQCAPPATSVGTQEPSPAPSVAEPQVQTPSQSRHASTPPKRGPGRQTWAKGSKLALLTRYKPEFQRACANSTTSEFYNSILKIWLTLYGYDLPIEEDSPVPPPEPPEVPPAAYPGMNDVDDDTKTARGLYIKALRVVRTFLESRASSSNSVALQKLRQWFYQSCKNVRNRELQTEAEALLQSSRDPKKPRKLGLLQGYAKWCWKDRIKPTFDVRWSPYEREFTAASDKGKDIKKEKAAKWMKVQRAVQKELWQREDEETKAAVKAMIDEHHKQALEEAEKGLDMDTPTTAEDYDRILKNIAPYLKNVADTISRRTGLVCAILLAGPIPDEGGRLAVRSMHAGQTRGVEPMEWPVADPAGWSEVERSMVKFTNMVYTQADMAARALTREDDNEDTLFTTATRLDADTAKARASPSDPLSTAAGGISNPQAVQVRTSPRSPPADAHQQEEFSRTSSPSPDSPGTGVPVAQSEPNGAGVQKTMPRAAIPPLPEANDMNPPVQSSQTRPEPEQALQMRDVSLETTPPPPPPPSASNAQQIATPLREIDIGDFPVGCHNAFKIIVDRYSWASNFPRWGVCVEGLLHLEIASNFPSKDVRLPKNSQGARPVEFKKWFQDGRPDKTPEDLDVQSFSKSCWNWWIVLQPHARGTTKQDRPENTVLADWNDSVRKPTVSGFYLVLVALVWWGAQIFDDGHRDTLKEWERLVDDVAWAVESWSAAEAREGAAASDEEADAGDMDTDETNKAAEAAETGNGAHRKQAVAKGKRKKPAGSSTTARKRRR